jgi:hypothetical protein
VNPYLIIGAFVLALASGIAGFIGGVDHEQAKLAKGYAAALIAKDAAIEEQRELNGVVSAALGKEFAGRAADAVDFQRRLADARKQPQKLVTAECPGGHPTATGGTADATNATDPRIRFTADFVRLWDDGLSIGATQGERAGRSDAGAAGPGVVEPTDLTANVGQNAERWAKCRSQVRGWQAWACKHGHAAKSECDGM